MECSNGKVIRNCTYIYMMQQGVTMTWAGNGHWVAELELKKMSHVEYKYAMRYVNAGSSCLWEGGDNHVLSFVADTHVRDTWQVRRYVKTD